MRIVGLTSVVIVVVTVMSSCSDGARQTGANPMDNQITIAASTDQTSYIIQYGLKGDDLMYIAVTGEKKPNNGFPALVVMGSRSTYLRKPNGEKITLPTTIQLFECINGHYREIRGRVTTRELQHFFQSNPTDYSIQALLESVQKQRAHKKVHKKGRVDADFEERQLML
jgi:hypothetical protein